MKILTLQSYFYCAQKDNLSVKKKESIFFGGGFLRSNYRERQYNNYLLFNHLFLIFQKQSIALKGLFFYAIFFLRLQ